jgi:hypothetical protein
VDGHMLGLRGQPPRPSNIAVEKSRLELRIWE